ncbi:DUF4091 domain-containing protein [Paenibacillus koleovorans]|uniref:DUF4091 domain-containing protein n=1 Tax=Paenibacillus koleovorans TaxID=121608 RepID=UPI000FD79D6E|nr:DUF4091 domain-containing protein [Paenibacillus koleovorans]
MPHQHQTHIWAVGDGEKVRRDDLANPNRDGNSVWDGHTVRLFGARNETIAFQLIVESQNSPIPSLSVEMSELRHRNYENAFIRNELAHPDDPNDYVGRRIEVFTQHYLYVPDELSTPPQWFYSASAPPLQMSGWIPDALIPHNARVGFGGQPVAVQPRANQGFWIDIYVPNDDALPPGLYTGAITVTMHDHNETTIPVELQLFDFALPQETHTKTMVYASDVSSYFPKLDAPKDALRKMAQRHRFNLVGDDVHGRAFDETALQAYRPYLDGSFFSRANGYEGPGEGVGEQIFPVGMYGSPVLGEEPAQMQAEADKWVNWFHQQKEAYGWNGAYFLYLIDEPRVDKFPWIQEQCSAIKSSEGPGRELPILTTRGFAQALEGSIDIWCSSHVTSEGKAGADRNGQPVWFYNGYRPSHGSIILEGDAVDMRVNSWLKWKHNIELYFVWHGTHWRHNHQGPRGRTNQNVYGYPVTFMYINTNQNDEFYYGGDGVHWGNGDGILFYPGHDPFYREQDRGIQAPISSIRMKNLRRGIQDYEYMWLAARQGKREQVDAIVNEAIPRVLHETDRDQDIAWSPVGSDWDGYRKNLADLLSRN